MRCNVTRFLAVLLILGIESDALAQSRIEEVLVTAPKSQRRALTPAYELDDEEITERAPVALTDIFVGMPSVGIRTNSRGEDVLRLRGSEERQTSIFLDGAPLSVPWDGHVDLSALPAGIVDQVQVTASAAPIEYGANSVLGVVDIRTPVLSSSGLHSLRAEMGTQSARSLSAVGGASAGGFDWVFGGAWRRLDAEAVSSRSTIPYGPTEDGARANTDLHSASLFVAASMERSWGVGRASLLSVDAERGIANAGHIDPDIGSPRYWRYPHWRFNQLTLNGTTDLGEAMTLRTTTWFQHFEQRIDQYTDDTYSVLESSEEDNDNTFGLRFVVKRPFDAFDARLVGNAQVTRHYQINADHLNDTRTPQRVYQQNMFSLGAEIDASPLDDVVLSTALSYDWAVTPKTGGRESQDALSDWAASIAAHWFLNDTWQIAGTLGQRTRFPTLRELYGEALGKFLVNLDLHPETALLCDVTLKRMSRDFTIRITPWLLRINDTLSQRSVVVNGVPRRQRYNLEGSTGHGVELVLDWNIDDRLEAKLNGTWQDLEARLEEDGTRPVLYQRPAFQGSLVVDYLFAPGWDLFFQAQYTGTAFDEDGEGTVVALPAATEINIRLFRTLHHEDSGRWRVYAGVDNLGDEIVLPQLGLPRPGRTVSLGVSFESM